MNGSTDDKELKAAFDEFKELLRRETEPVGPSEAPEISLEPRVDPRHAYGASGAPARGSEQPSLGARPMRAPERAPAGDAVFEIEPTARDEAARRRKLVYLSFAIILAGLGGLGWTIARGTGGAEEPAVADLAVPGEPAPLAGETDQAALETPAIDAARETPDPESAASPSPEKAASAPQAPAREAATGAGEATPEAVPLPAVPVETVAPSAPKPVKAVAAPAAEASGATASAPAPAARPAAPARKPAAATPAANTAALESPTAAEPARTPTPTPAVKPTRAAKPKPKPAQAAAKPRPPATEAASPAPAEAEIVVPPPAPAPPPPAENNGALGFVKRTVNSVGSTIGNIGKAVIP